MARQLGATSGADPGGSLGFDEPTPIGYGCGGWKRPNWLTEYQSSSLRSNFVSVKTAWIIQGPPWARPVLACRTTQEWPKFVPPSMQKCVCGRGSAPNPNGGAYGASPYSLAAKGRGQRGKERRSREENVEWREGGGKWRVKGEGSREEREVTNPLSKSWIRPWTYSTIFTARSE